MRHAAPALTAALATLSFQFAHASERALPVLHSPPLSVAAFENLSTDLRYAGGTPRPHLVMQSAAGVTIPLWIGSAQVRRKTYRYMMVGRDPATGHSPAIPVKIIPVKLIFDDLGGAIFDPTAPDPTCSPDGTALQLTMTSPLFENIRINTLGRGQYTSLFQRGNFFTANSKYSVRFDATALPLQTVHVTGGQLRTAPCGRAARFSITQWRNYLQNTLMARLAKRGVGPTTIPIFLFYNVFLAQSPTKCCFAGFHAAFNNPSFGGAFQVYATAAFNTTGQASPAPDDSILAHEAAELVADPAGQNLTPPWGHIGQFATSCSSKMEVADPAQGNIRTFRLHGVTYHMPDLAFTSWFYRQKPANSYNGLYSLFGNFRTPARRCPPPQS